MIQTIPLTWASYQVKVFKNYFFEYAIIRKRVIYLFESVKKNSILTTGFIFI